MRNKRILLGAVPAFLFGCVLLFFLLMSPARSTVQAATNCQNFPQTGHQVCGKFLTYWQTHGGLTQQGYPISDTFQERNAPPPAGDGQVHTVQYFERARFEQHDENQPPYDTLLGLLGSEQFHAKYPSGNPGVPVTQLMIINGKSTQGQINSYTAKAGYVYLLLDLTINNTTNAQISTNLYNFSVRTQQGFDYDFTSATFLLDKSMKLQHLDPGQSARGLVAFEVPTNETPISVTFEDSPTKVTVTIP